MTARVACRPRCIDARHADSMDQSSFGREGLLA